MQTDVSIKRRNEGQRDRSDGWKGGKKGKRGSVFSGKLEKGTKSIKKEVGRGENWKAGGVHSEAIDRCLWPQQSVTVIWASFQLPGGGLPLASPKRSGGKPTISTA